MSSRFRIGLIAYFALVSGGFAWQVPPFEAPDEPFHLDYVDFLLRERTLPHQYDEAKSVFREGHQPPLYYMLAAVVAGAANGGEPLAIALERDPRHVLAGGPSHGVPYYRHDRHDEELPRTRTAFAFYALRLLGIALGCLNLWWVLRLSERFIDDPVWCRVPPIFIATLPQFAFVSASIGNDSLANLLATACIATTLRLWQAPSLRRWALLGTLVGLGLLAKKTLLVLAPPIAFVLVWPLRDGLSQSRIALRRALAFALPVMLLAGWWFARNRWLYGDLLGSEMERQTLAFIVHERPLWSAYFVSDFPRLVSLSFVGLFGWMQVPLPRLVYVAWALPVAAALAAAAAWVPASERLRRALLAGFVGSGVAGVVYYNMTFPEPQGRFLFPVLPCLALLVAEGGRAIAAHLGGGAWRRAILPGLWGLGGLLDGLALWRVAAFYGG